MNSERTVSIQSETGLHARPAAELVQKAQKFESHIEILKGEKVANAKSIMSLMGLGVSGQSEVTLKAEGADAEAALNSLEAYLSTLQ